MSNYNDDGDRAMSNAEIDEFVNETLERDFDVRDASDGDSDSDGDKPYVELHESNSAFGRRIREFEIINFGFKDVEPFLLSAFNKYQQKITEAVAQFNSIKTVAYFNAEFERSFVKDDGDENATVEKRLIYIPTIIKEIQATSDLREHFQRDIIGHVLRIVEEVMVEGSGFKLSKIIKLTVQVFEYKPLTGSGFIELPKRLKNKKSIVNLKNTNDECFKWSILAALHYDEVYARDKNKVKDAWMYAQWSNELNFDGIDFPMRINQIEKFMIQNDGLAVNVYYLDSDKNRLCPLFLAMKPTNYRYIHLLYLTQPLPNQTEEIENENGNENVESHYCWIKDLSALVHKQITKNTRRIFLCDRCLNYFSSHEKLEKHKMLCTSMNDCAIEMPRPEESYQTFKNYKNEIKAPFIIYADTETLMKEPETSVFGIDSSTHAHNEHEVHSIGYYYKDGNEEIKSRYVTHRGPKCIDLFMNDLTDIAMEAFDFLERKKSMNALTEEEEKEFHAATVCHICKKTFKFDADTKKSEIRVRDHCHISGWYRGAAHQSCNLQYQISRTIPVVMHNLSGFDSHLLIKKLSNKEKMPGEIKIIPHNSEKYIAFVKTMRGIGPPKTEKKYKRVIKFQFIDSLRFMSASLDYLASILPHEKKDILKSECVKSGYSNHMFNLLIRKGVFPYEYIDCYEKLEECALPPKELFYSKLTESHVSDGDYEHAKQVWNEFGVQTLGEYSDLYLKTDVLLLADVFESFRNTCHTAYSLDPAHYFSAPGLSYDAMLKKTNVSVELFTDVDMLMFAEKGLRGGVVQVNKRYVKANNIHMGDEFDASKESSYLLYLDSNNLYGYAMTQYLPIGEYRWLSKREIKRRFDTADQQKNVLSILNLMDDSNTGYIFEVDLHYPIELHDKHNDFPFCPENRGIPGITKNNKLMLTFYDKKNYIVHYRMLKLALEHGLVLEKVHRVLEFKQSKWLEEYINLNTRYRSEANNDFEKDFYKLLNNAIYGKTCENLRNRSDIRLVNEWDGRAGIRRLIARPNFKGCKIIDENLVSIEMQRTHVLMNRPIVVGMCILDISKVLMYKFLYNYLKPKFKQNIQVCYTDTDAYILEIKSPNVYAEIYKEPDINEFDTWDYPEDNVYGVPRRNNKVIGKFKDELKGIIISELIALRPKCYAIRTVGGVDKMKKAKGVKKNVLKNRISFDDYYNCLKENCIEVRKQYSIRSKSHNVYTISMEKIALNPFDDKRYLIDMSGVDTLAWGHYRIDSQKMEEKIQYYSAITKSIREFKK